MSEADTLNKNDTCLTSEVTSLLHKFIATSIQLLSNTLYHNHYQTFCTMYHDHYYQTPCTPVFEIEIICNTISVYLSSNIELLLHHE